MNLKKRQFLVWSAAACIALAGPLVLLIAAIEPVQMGRSSISSVAPNVAASAPATAAAPPVDPAELQQLCSRDLRRPLSADATVAAAPTGAPLTVQLVGIASEPGHSMAMFRKRDGTTAVCALGEVVDDVGGPATVTRIDPDRISIQYLGTVRELAMPRSPLAAESTEP
jgi:hypothetical protein